MKNFSHPLSVGELYEEIQKDLQIVWVSGKNAEQKILSKLDSLPETGIISYFNMVHISQVHVLDKAEIEYLDSLDKDMLTTAYEKLFDKNCRAIIVANGYSPTQEMREQADKHKIALFQSQMHGEHLLNDLHYYLSLALAPKITLHGVFIEVISIGVLLAGDSGAGKSELALELISRGHRLIADDAPIFTRIAPDIIEGASPPTIQDFLEVRGLGILNIRKMYGNSAIKKSKYLKFIIDLKNATEHSAQHQDRLHNAVSEKDVLGLKIPMSTLPVAPGRNLAVLIEAAVINHSLRINNYHAEQELSQRQALSISNNEKR